MLRFILPTIAGICLATLPETAHALCAYNGELYAKTTIAQEYKDSKWVARVKVLSVENHFFDTDEESYTTYQLEVLDVFKGPWQETFKFLSYRNSGGFYFEKSWQGADIGSEYLVFLNPNAVHSAIEKGTVFVNYNCGQSKPWSEVSSNDRSTLQHLRTKR